MKKKAILSLSAFFLAARLGTVSAGSVEASFEDVPKDHWAYSTVQQLVDDGVVTGYPDGEFKGDHLITRYEMSMVVAKAIDRYDKVSEKDQAMIDKLSAEYASELNRLGKRVARVEQRTNSWISGDSRVRFMGNTSHEGGSKLKGGNRFDYRHRLTWHGDVNNKISETARLTIGNKFGEGSNNQKYNVRMDLAYINVKDFMGLDSIRVGRSQLDVIGNGLIGKGEGNDGILLKKSLGKTTYKLYTGDVNQDWNSSTQDSQQLTTAEITHAFNDKFSAGLGYYWADIDRTATGNGKGNLNVAGNSTSTEVAFHSARGADLGFCWKLGKYRLFGDYIFTHINDLSSSYSRLSSNPKGWALEFTNGVGPATYFCAVDLVDPAKAGSDAWMVSYRSIDAGAVPVGGFDTFSVADATEPYSVFSHGTDNVNAVSLAYQKVWSKNVVMTLQYDRYYIKNRGLTTLSSNKLDDLFKMQFQFWY